MNEFSLPETTSNQDESKLRVPKENFKEAQELKPSDLSQQNQPTVMVEILRTERRISELRTSFGNLEYLYKRPEMESFPTGVVSDTKEITGGQVYRVLELTKNILGSVFGSVLDEDQRIVSVRSDLPDRVKRFLIAHKKYHYEDKSNFAGGFGREVRANLVPGLKDPIGLVATIWMTVTSKERRKFYQERTKGLLGIR